MLGICSYCGNTEWDKVVEGNKIICPKCGAARSFFKLPFYVITGCSGIGKTTTAVALQKLTQDFIIQDVDLFYNIMQPQTDEENLDMLEQVFSISKNMTQSGKAVVWIMAGSIDKLLHTYGKRFFSEIKVLALTADSEIIRNRRKSQLSRIFNLNVLLNKLKHHLHHL